MSTPDRIPLNVLFGIPDHGPDVVRVTQDGRHLHRVDSNGAPPTHLAKLLLRTDESGVERITLLGSANLVPYLSRERFKIHRFFLQKGADLRIKIGPGAILNQIADPDMSPSALRIAARLVSQIQRPCFNHPAAVARTSRDEVSRLLTGTAGLNVPKAIRLRAPTPASVREAIAQNGLEYPVLMRGIGSQGGVSLFKVDEPRAIDEIAWNRGMAWGIFVTEFRDFVSSDGRYRKFRVVVIGQDILLRHCIVGDNWLLSAGRRADGTADSERAMFDRFDREWATSLRPVFAEIGSRLGLDFVGVDCNIDEHGQVLLFEANACMNVLKNTSPSPNMWDAPIERIRSALEERLASPSAWYRPAA